MSTAVLHAAPSSPHAGSIEFGQTHRLRGGWAGTVTIEYDGAIWAIDLDMIDVYLAGMVGFFEEIARSDWSGTTRWQSEFQELSIEAAEDNGLVKLAFSIWWSRGDELDNEREGKLAVSRDELPQFAARIRELTKLQRDANRLGWS